MNTATKLALWAPLVWANACTSHAIDAPRARDLATPTTQAPVAGPPQPTTTDVEPLPVTSAGTGMAVPSRYSPIASVTAHFVNPGGLRW